MGHHPRHSARARPGAARATLPSWQRDRGRLLAARWQGTAQGSEVQRWPGGSAGLHAGLWQPPAGVDSGLCPRFSQFISERLTTHCEAHPVKTQNRAASVHTQARAAFIMPVLERTSSLHRGDPVPGAATPSPPQTPVCFPSCFAAPGGFLWVQRVTRACL